jgi:hypothetical protein
MAQQQHENTDETVRLLIRKLESVRQACADSAEDERRQAFRQALDEELRGVPEDARPAVVTAVRDGLIRDAREREQRLEELEREVARLRTSLASLEQENESLRSSQAEGAGPGVDSEGELAKLRDGLVILTMNQQISAESTGLPPDYARLFRLVQGLFQFAIDYEMGVNLVLGEFGVGPVSEMDTRMISGFKQVVRSRFRACLEDKEGSLAALKETLTRNSRFPVDLISAYKTSIHAGSQGLLAKVEPQSILDQSKRMIGYDYEQAWKTFIRYHNDLVGLPPDALWERFFSGSFREGMSSYLDQGERSD